jgi:hypothetical protein
MTAAAGAPGRWPAPMRERLTLAQGSSRVEASLDRSRSRARHPASGIRPPSPTKDAGVAASSSGCPSPARYLAGQGATAGPEQTVRLGRQQGRLPMRTDRRVARFGPTTPTRARKLADASVDPTDARKATVRRFGRSYRSSKRRSDRRAIRQIERKHLPSAACPSSGAKWRPSGRNRDGASGGSCTSIPNSSNLFAARQLRRAWATVVAPIAFFAVLPSDRRADKMCGVLPGQNPRRPQ